MKFVRWPSTPCVKNRPPFLIIFCVYFAHLAYIRSCLGTLQPARFRSLCDIISLCPATFCFRLCPQWRKLVPVDRCDLNIRKKARDTNSHRLIRLKALSRLLIAKPTRLVGGLAITDFKGQDGILDATMRGAQVRIPVASVANIPCPNARSGRATAALLACGSIGGFPCQALFITPVLIEASKRNPSFRKTNSSLPEGYR